MVVVFPICLVGYCCVVVAVVRIRRDSVISRLLVYLGAISIKCLAPESVCLVLRKELLKVKRHSGISLTLW